MKTGYLFGVGASLLRSASLGLIGWLFGFIVLLGIIGMPLGSLVQAQQPPGSKVRPFYIGFENPGVPAGCGQNITLGGSNDSNSLQAFRFLIEYGGYTPAQAAGIVGNLKAESGTDPLKHQRGALGGSGPGRGIAQWEIGHSLNNNRGRWENLLGFAEIFGLDEWALSTQLSFMIFELQGRPPLPAGQSLPGAYSTGYGHASLVEAETPEAAAIVFLNKFERAGERAEDRRKRFARNVYEEFSGLSTVARDLDADMRCGSYLGGSFNIDGCPEAAVLSRGNEIVSVSNSVDGSVSVHRCIQENIRRLFADINRELEGVGVGGSGWRSNDSQIMLRTRNCKGTDGVADNYDIYDKPARECHPDTARPGFSQHQQGLAIDFWVNSQGETLCYAKATCDGSDPESHRRVFEWLNRNAATRYGLEKLSSEAWHWSIGRG